MGPYSILQSVDVTIVFKYIVIMIFTIVLFRSKNIGLNVVFAVVVGIVVIMYIHERDTASNQLEEVQKKTKLDAIKPEPKHFKDKNDVINFFFSVQDFYRYNPETYEECVVNVRAFFQIYEIIFIGTDFCDDYFSIAKTKKNNAINAFHALIYSLPNNKIVTEKFDRAHKRLETILNKYLNEMYDKCKEQLLIEGPNIHRRAINTGPDEYNTYFNLDKSFTYQFY